MLPNKSETQFDYKKNYFSFVEVRGRIYEADYVHYRFGSKVLKSIADSSRVLDLGCGAGGLTKAWQNSFENLKFSGIDVSKTAIEMAKINNGQDIDFRVSGTEKLPYKDDSFAAVLCCEVLEHVNNPQKMLTEIYRVMQKGGRLYLTTPIEADKRTLIGLLYGSKGIKIKEKITGHIQLFTEYRLRQLFTNKDFRVDDLYFDRILIGQIMDFVYTHFLLRRKSKVLVVTRSLQDKGGLTWLIGLAVMRILSLIVNLETILFRKVVGLGMQVEATKI